ncbi:MAG: hypothetical protein O2958_14060 [Gemmatimonadetes bacterium]|nr:hypothetical protein [Gemmatimonadota bacterium]MDA1104339.1 hypothetical protein [Gemmatimonadota bacterium]
MRRIVAIVAGTSIGLAMSMAQADAQRLIETPRGGDPPIAWSWDPARGSAGGQSMGSRHGPGAATALSAILPGAGQHVLGQRRKWAYLALETLGWVLYFDRRSAGADFRDQYRDFAWNEARTQVGPRMDGRFGYYETLSKWTRSGAFDADPSTEGIQPEPDVLSFNGSVWDLATRLFVTGGPTVPESDPQYQRALGYYQREAYGSDFLWDWTGTGGAQDAFGSLIRLSDDRFREATNVVGALIANHIVSAVDAYLSARGVPVPSEARLVPMRGLVGIRWTTRIDISPPR